MLGLLLQQHPGGRWVHWITTVVVTAVISIDLICLHCSGSPHTLQVLLFYLLYYVSLIRYSNSCGDSVPWIIPGVCCLPRQFEKHLQLIFYVRLRMKSGSCSSTASELELAWEAKHEVQIVRNVSRDISVMCGSSRDETVCEMSCVCVRCHVTWRVKTILYWRPLSFSQSTKINV